MGTFTRMAEDWKRQNRTPIMVCPEPRAGAETAAHIPEDDPDAWREPFQRWYTSECVFRPRCFGGIGSLHVHFCDWAIANDAVPCTRRTFEALLRAEGFLTADGMVSELILKEDWDACHQPGQEKR